MKYIKKIILENFQSHKHTEIELNDQLNIIVGPSDSGKTAIMRAIKWALYNEPSGDYFIREGENNVSVSLIFSDNTQLTRYRSKTKNVYELLYNNGEELRLEGFGTGVPEEIKEAMGIYKINLDGKETNAISLGEQLEGPFLLSEKTSTRASAIGQLVGVDVIDEALREVLKDVRSLNSTKRHLEGEIESLGEEIKTFDYLEELKTTIGKASTIRKKVVEYKGLLDKLNYDHEILKKLSDDIHRLEKIKERLSRLDDIDGILTSLESKYTKYWQLSNYNRNLKKVMREIRNNEALLDKLKNMDESMAIESKLIDFVKEHKSLLNTNIKYRRIKEEKRNLNNNIVDLWSYLKQEDHLIKIEDLYNRLLKLNRLKERYLPVKISIDKGKNYIEKFEFIDDALEKDKVLGKNIDLLRKLNKLHDEILIINKNIVHEGDRVDKTKSDIAELVDRYKTILNSIERCPLCLSEIHNDRIEHILAHYIGG